MNDNITILIQGPYNNISVDKIEEYKNITNNIIYSTWDHPNLKDLPEYVDIVSHKLCEKGYCYCCNKPMKNLIQDSTIAWAVSTTYAGLKEINTEYTIKLRSDEYYNLEPFVEKMMNNKDKILFGNIFVRRFSELPYHMGDHIFGGKTKIFNKTYENIFKDAHQYSEGAFHKHYFNYYRQKTKPPFWPAECMLACNILRSMELEVSRESLEKVFELIDINDMKPFFASYQHMNLTFKDNYDPAKVGEVYKVHSMEDFLS